MSSGGAATDCRVCAAIRACRGEFIAVAVFSFFENLLLLAVPIYMLQVYDRVFSSRSTETLVYLSLIVLLSLTVLGILHLARSRLLNGIGLWLEHRLAPGLFERAVQSKLRRSNYGPEAIADLGTLRGFVSSPAMMALFDLPWTPIFIAAAFFLHWTMGVLAVLSVCVLVALTVASELLTKKSVHGLKVASMLGRQQLEGTSRNAEVIEAMGMMPAVTDRWLKQNVEALNLQSNVSQTLTLMTSVTKWFRMLVQVLGLALTAWLVLLNEVTAGVVIASSIILTRSIGPIEQTVGAWKSIASVRDSVMRLKAFAMEPEYRPEAMPLPEPEGHLSVENLYYQPSPFMPPVLKGVTFKIEPGEALAIVGPSGAGKSSLARLLVGAFPPSGGIVRLDGADVFTWERASFGKFVGYVPQDVELFAGTMAENIARMGDVDPEAIVAAAKMSNVHDLILAMPKGYETQIGADGQYLSGGQKQRIALARAIVGPPRLVVLDEPNSNLDGDGEMALMNTMAGLKAAGCSVVVVTHRPALVQHVDKMLLLRNGMVEAFGPRQEVFARLVGQPVQTTGQPATVQASV